LFYFLGQLRLKKIIYTLSANFVSGQYSAQGQYGAHGQYGNMVHVPFSRSIRYVINKKRLEKELNKERWVFSGSRVVLIANESASWERYYLPVSVKDKVVLDVGAGEGETARFFLEHGAKKVTCIEANQKAFYNLRRNSLKHNSITAVFKRFNPSDLTAFPCDFLKVDIEGYEECLLNVQLTFPAVIEVHGLQLRNRFRDKGYRIDDSRSCEEASLFSYAYWMC
jgi:SAM-dependent methyltransferase